MRQRAVDFFDGGPVRRGLYSLAEGMRRHNAARIASAMAFNLFLAAIPMLAFAGWLAAHLLGRSPDSMGVISLYVDVTPLELHDLVQKNFKRFSAADAVAPIAILGSLWLASSAFHMLMSVFEVAVRARKRAWWKKRLIALGCVVGGTVAFAGTAFLTVSIAGGPAALVRLLRAGEDVVGPAQRATAVVVALLAATVSLAAFFRIAVRRPGVTRRVWPGALVTVAIGGAASYVFGFYARTIAGFALFYGGLAAVAVALAWLWIWCGALLLGAELNAQLEGGDRIAPPSTARLETRRRSVPDARAG